MIQKLITKMPAEFLAAFEHFALQLQLIITTATRVRKVVEEGAPDAIQQVMDHTDSSGIISQILKQAIVQAGIEVAEIRNRHTSWTKNTEHRLSRLLRSADDAQAAQAQLNQLQSQIGSFGATQNEKSKKMMAGVASGNDKALKAVVFSSWYTFQQKMKGEKDIRDMFEAEIANLDQKLMDYRAASLSRVRSVLTRKGAEADTDLKKTVWKAWWSCCEETRRECGSQAAMNAMEEKLAASSAAQMENTKKVMNKMAAGSDGALLKVVFTSWIQWLADYKKNKDEEEAIRAQEKQMEEFMKAKKDGAKAVLDKMNASTDSGLLEHVISTWGQHYKDEKEAKKLEEMMAANEARFAGLTGRQKDNAMGVQQRVNEQMDLNVMLKHFSAWATDTKLERIMRHYNSKMEGKKQQLQSVQHLFKNFATQLDQGLKEGDSARDSRRKKDEFSLPEIQKK